jgi:hypothetical protein
LAARSSASSGDIVRAVGSGMAEVFVRLRGPSMIGFSIYFAFEIVQISIAPGMCGIFLTRPLIFEITPTSWSRARSFIR